MKSFTEYLMGLSNGRLNVCLIALMGWLISEHQVDRR